MFQPRPQLRSETPGQSPEPNIRAAQARVQRVLA
jgi:hypothetical protein